MKYTAEDVKDLLSSNFLYIEFGKITEDAAAYLINAAVEREQSPLPKVVDAKDLIEGEWYWWVREVRRVHFTGASGKFFVVGAHSERPNKNNPAYGPIPRPVDACEGSRPHE